MGNPTKSDWLVPAALVALALVPALGGAARLAQLATHAEVTPANARFVAAPVPIVLHVVTAIVYGILGAFQFPAGLRRRRRGWHRAAGRVLIPCALLVAGSGLWMTVAYPWAPGDGVAVYAERLVFGTAMLASVLLGIDAIRRRDFVAHGQWMIRAYAIGMGAGTQVLTHVPWFLLAEGRPGETGRGIMMGLGWVINVVVAEWVIIRQPAGARSRVVVAA